ncbi:MAG: oligosaccharide flippase family protein, partial [Longimicrobiales bacterium]
TFGLLALAWLVHGYANELGFARATTKFAAEQAHDADGERLARVAWSTFALQFAFGLVAGAVLLLATPLLVDHVLRMPASLTAAATGTFRILALSVPVVVLGAGVRGLLEALQRFDLVNAVRAPTTALNFLLPVAGLAAGLGITEIVALLLAARLAALIAYATLAVRLVPALQRPTLGTSELRRVASFGGWTSVSGVLSPLLIYLDRFLLGALVSVAAVAYYAAPYEVVARLLIVPASLVAALFPEFSALHVRGEAARVGELSARAVKFTLLAVGPVAVLLIGAAPDLLRWWLGVEYAAAGAVALQILAVGIVINAVAHVPVAVLHGAGRPEVPARFHLLELPLHAAVAVTLIGWWGVAGAAAAWTVRVAIDAGLLLFAVNRTVTGAAAALRVERVPQAAALLAGFATAAFAATSALQDAWARAIVVVVLVAVLGIVLWRVGLHRAERDRLVGLIVPARAG